VFKFRARGVDATAFKYLTVESFAFCSQSPFVLAQQSQAPNIQPVAVLDVRELPTGARTLNHQRTNSVMLHLLQNIFLIFRPHRPPLSTHIESDHGVVGSSPTLSLSPRPSSSLDSELHVLLLISIVWYAFLSIPFLVHLLCDPACRLHRKAFARWPRLENDWFLFGLTYLGIFLLAQLWPLALVQLMGSMIMKLLGCLCCNEGGKTCCGVRFRPPTRKTAKGQPDPVGKRDLEKRDLESGTGDRVPKSFKGPTMWFQRERDGRIALCQGEPKVKWYP